MPPAGQIRRCRTGRAVALAAALALGLATAGAGSETPADTQAAPEQPGSTPGGRELYRLPDDYRSPLGTFNQVAIVAQQKTRLEIINERLSMRLRLTETRHYLVFGEAGSPIAARFTQWSEVLHANLLKHLALSETARVWDGKCVLILFARRPKFEQYAQVFDGHDVRQAGAYFAIEQHGADDPSLVHMCFPIETRDERRQQELFAHEGTHAFFELYKTPGRLPLWLHEGLAEYMTTVNDPALRPVKWQASAVLAVARAPLRRLLAAKPGDELSRDQYSAAFTLVDFLLAEGRHKFKTFVDALKDGKDQNAALRQAYGFAIDELVRRWHAYARQYRPAGP